MDSETETMSAWRFQLITVLDLGDRLMSRVASTMSKQYPSTYNSELQLVSS